MTLALGESISLDVFLVWPPNQVLPTLIPTHVDDAGRLFLAIIELCLVGKKQIRMICSKPVVQEATKDEGGEEGERGEGGEVGEAEAWVDIGGQHG